MAKEPETVNNLPRLKAALRQKQPEQLYVFYGEEIFLLNYYLGQLKKLLIDDLTESFNYHKLTKETFSASALADILEYPPMMAERTLTVVDEVDIFALPEDDRKTLCRIFEDIPAYCTLIFTYETTPWDPGKQPKMNECLQKHGVVVEFAKQERSDLIDWTLRHFAAEKKTIRRELCGYLVDITGGDMTTLSGEIVKICAYSGADEIVKSDIDAVTEPMLDVVIFHMTDALSEGAYGTALRKLQQLQQKMQQEEKDLKKRCTYILGMIGKHFRLIGAARILSDHGKPATELMKLCRAAKYPANKAMTTAKRVSHGYCAKAMKLILETDYKMKTGYGEPDQLLELLVLQLAQEARHA